MKMKKSKVQAVIMKTNGSSIPDYIDCSLNSFAIRIYCDVDGREPGYTDDIKLELEMDDESIGLKMDIHEARLLMSQLQNAITEQNKITE